MLNENIMLYMVNVVLLQTAWTEPEWLFSEGIQKYWGNLAKNGEPGTQTINEQSVEWIEYDAANLQTMVFTDNNTMMISNNDNSHCDFWDSLGYNWITDN